MGGDWYASSLLQAKLQLLDHQAHHGGNDVIALVASFLLIQLLRFGISAHVGACFAGAGYFIRRKVASLPAKRGLLAFQLSMAMTKSWCFFFAGVWIMGSNGVAKKLAVSEESA